MLVMRLMKVAGLMEDQMANYTPDFLISAAKAWIKADADRMSRRPSGFTRSAWRAKNPISLQKSWLVQDMAFRTQPQRCFCFDANGSPYDLWVWSTGKAPRVIERINLRAGDAANKLTRYEIV